MNGTHSEGEVLRQQDKSLGEVIEQAKGRGSYSTPSPGNGNDTQFKRNNLLCLLLVLYKCTGVLYSFSFSANVYRKITVVI